jgi:hypothetical protein
VNLALLLFALALAISIPLFRMTAESSLSLGSGSGGREAIDLEKEGRGTQWASNLPRSISGLAVRSPQARDADERWRESGLRQGRAAADLWSGTLMLRLAIQISMLLAIPLMAIFLYVFRSLAPCLYLLRTALQFVNWAGLCRECHQ